MRLRTNIASPLLLECLRKIMTNKAFDNHYLVGGTALALQRGHRISIDIDMFTNVLYGEGSVPKAHYSTQSYKPTRRCSVLPARYNKKPIFEIDFGDKEFIENEVFKIIVPASWAR